MELHALDRKLAVTQTHYESFLGLGRDLKHIGNRVALDDEGVITRRGDRVGKTAEHARAVVANLRSLAVHDARCPHDVAAVELADALQAETHTEHRGSMLPERADRVIRQAGISLAVIDRFKGRVPLLGVCLGHQAIGQAYGGHIVHAKTLMHGKVSSIHHSGKGVFAGLPSPYPATRYHSLAIERATCPAELEVTAWTDDGEIMGVRHRSLPVEGVQFHPESILTEHGHALLRNFLSEPTKP